MKTGARSPGAEASEKDGACAPRRVSGTRRIVSDTALRNAKPQAQAYKITITSACLCRRPSCRKMPITVWPSMS
jgi:hypothetical protein